MTPRVPARVLSIAGSDSSGGAGIQADIKSISALGGYAATALTAITAQNTRGVFGIQPVAIELIVQQIQVVVEDIGCDAIKTGMLGTAGITAAVAAALRRHAPGIPLIVDPVMVSTSGSVLLDDAAVTVLCADLIPLATVLTPNVPEAERLSGQVISDAVSLCRAGEIILGLGAQAVLIKGGHLPGIRVVDALITPAGLETFSEPRLQSRHTHGTGCTLSAALATGLAQGLDLRSAVARARAYVRAAIAAAPGFGQGHGPLNHLVADTRNCLQPCA